MSEPLSMEGHSDLPYERESYFGQFDTHRRFVHGFKKARPKLFVQLNRASEDSISHDDVVAVQQEILHVSVACLSGGC